MRMERLNRQEDRRGSGRDAALIRIQLEAQARNRRWYDFLCARRDELQTRLNQQGNSSYSPDSEVNRIWPVADDTAAETQAGRREQLPAGSTRWGRAGTSSEKVDQAEIEVEAETELAGDQTAAETIGGGHTLGPTGRFGWWQERDEGPL